MRVLVVGSGGREHAIAWKLAQEGVQVLSAPGNPGMAELGPVFPVAADDLDGLVALAADQRPDLAVIGPEIPLVAGLADRLRTDGLAVFGPSAAAARIEGSKVFCRDLARRHGVPIAEGETFEDPDAALDFARTIAPPIVLKAEGLAAGKGVLICADLDEARVGLDRIMRERVFGDAGRRVIVEEFLEGRETSIFCLTDGDTRLILEPAQDYKRIGENDSGPNTGGMGSYSPVPWLAPEVRQRAIDEVVMPLLDALAEQGSVFTGCFYCGLMFTAKGPRLIEINCRFGDPETQVLLPRLASNLGELLTACASGGLAEVTPAWREQACVSVVAASGGYPGGYTTGERIRGLEEAGSLADVAVFHAGTASDGDGVVTAGGRVLNISALGDSIADARRTAYEATDRISWKGMYVRRDIAADV